MRIADEQDKMREREQHITTWSIDFAFMIDNGDGASWMGQDQRYSVGERGSGGGIHAHLVLATGKIKDDIEEFGYGGAFVRIKSDQETAIVDVQRAVIAKRGNAPTIPANSPVGDSQSNGRVENAIKKVRNMAKTILSSLESKMGRQSDS